jgi:cytochrome c553
MRLFARARTRKAIGIVAATIAAAAIGAVLFAWSGVYTIAASRGHWTVVEWFLEFGMRNSVKRRAWAIEVPPLDHPDLYALGAAHFHRACTHCHGAPGIKGDLTARRALPPPPDLTHVSREWKANELFWIVKHGIKYTGMPAWVALERDDEVWAVVAFLQKLPGLDANAYRGLVRGAAEVPQQSGHDIATLGPAADVVGACARCHGAEQRGPVSGLVPVLHGQPSEVLLAALKSYADGTRLSGMMQPVAQELSGDAIEKLAAYYSSLPVPENVRGERSASAAALATAGDPAAKIPACTGCHAAAALAVYPRLAGQNAPYMANRLRLWKAGLPPSSDSEAIMAPIARLLSDAQIAELSDYFASLPPGPAPGGQSGRSP